VGADLLAKTAQGDTALHLACRAGHIRVARRLVKAEGRESASLKLPNLKGKLPVDVVPRGAHSLLREALAQEMQGRRFRRRRRPKPALVG
jgi:ankyrin repeat protein